MRWLAIGLAGLTLGLAVFAPHQLTAQEGTRPGILVIDPERLFQETQFGRRVQQDIEQRAAALAAENRRIEAELVAEERELTEQRPSLPVTEFRALADAFDTKVDRIRAEQDAKTREIQRLSEIERQRFFSQIGSVLSTIVSEDGASVVLDRRSVFFATENVDITARAVAAIDAEIGDGTETPAED